LITEHDLQEAIAECQGVKNPTMNTCIKLAALYTIRNELYGNPDKFIEQSYSYSNGNKYESDSEFWRKAKNMPVDDLAPILDDLMDALSITNPRLYDAFIRRLKA